MPELDACPLCRTVLEPEAVQCPGCGADLTPYLDISTLVASYVSFARELLSRGETAEARLIIERLPQLTAGSESELSELTARLLLQEGNIQAVEKLMPQCDAAVSAEIRDELQERQRARRRARELYNHALTAARAGSFAQASFYLNRAVNYDTSDPNIWALMLKAALKAGLHEHCYAALTELDRLGARPPEFHRLEELLPPVVEQASQAGH